MHVDRMKSARQPLHPYVWQLSSFQHLYYSPFTLCILDRVCYHFCWCLYTFIQSLNVIKLLKCGFEIFISFGRASLALTLSFAPYLCAFLFMVLLFPFPFGMCRITFLYKKNPPFILSNMDVNYSSFSFVVGLMVWSTLGKKKISYFKWWAVWKWRFD